MRRLVVVDQAPDPARQPRIARVEEVLRGLLVGRPEPGRHCAPLTSRRPPATRATTRAPHHGHGIAAENQRRMPQIAAISASVCTTFPVAFLAQFRPPDVGHCSGPPTGLSNT